jgi:hypothetical protein
VISKTFFKIQLSNLGVFQMNTELNEMIIRQVIKVRKAKQNYDLAVSEGKLKYTLYEDLPSFYGLTIQEAIDTLKRFKRDLPDGVTVSTIESNWDEGDYVKYSTCESDAEYESRLIQLQQILECEQKELYELELK